MTWKPKKENMEKYGHLCVAKTQCMNTQYFTIWSELLCNLLTEPYSKFLSTSEETKFVELSNTNVLFEQQTNIMRHEDFGQAHYSMKHDLNKVNGQQSSDGRRTFLLYYD